MSETANSTRPIAWPGKVVAWNPVTGNVCGGATVGAAAPAVWVGTVVAVGAAPEVEGPGVVAGVEPGA